MALANTASHCTVAKAIRFRLKGVKQLERNLHRLGDRAEMVLGQALYEEGERIMGQSKMIVPVDTGALRGSGNVSPPQKARNWVKVILSYGGAAAQYAIYVHENLTARHKPPTRAKYLEEPFKRAQVGLLGRLARRIRHTLGG
jgi:hypothetical protein